MTALAGLLARAQTAVQNNRAVPELAHRAFGRFSTVSTEPFLDAHGMPWTALLERHYPAIRAEADRVLAVREALPNFQDIGPDQIRLSDDDRWKAFWFVGYGVWDDPNCLRCPATAAVLRAIPGLTTGFLSILGPGKRLPPHYGPYRGVLRHHLALVVPEPADACGIRVGGQVRHWTEGQSLVFDDTYEHEAWNDTEGERVVLFLDIRRPLQRPVSWINGAIIAVVRRSPFVAAARAARREGAAIRCGLGCGAQAAAVRRPSTTGLLNGGGTPVEAAASDSPRRPAHGQAEPARYSAAVAGPDVDRERRRRRTLTGLAGDGQGRVAAQ